MWQNIGYYIIIRTSGAYRFKRSLNNFFFTMFLLKEILIAFTKWNLFWNQPHHVTIYIYNVSCTWNLLLTMFLWKKIHIMLFILKSATTLNVVHISIYIYTVLDNDLYARETFFTMFLRIENIWNGRLRYYDATAVYSARAIMNVCNDAFSSYGSS